MHVKNCGLILRLICCAIDVLCETRTIKNIATYSPANSSRFSGFSFALTRAKIRVSANSCKPQTDWVLNCSAGDRLANRARRKVSRIRGSVNSSLRKPLLDSAVSVEHAVTVPSHDTERILHRKVP